MNHFKTLEFDAILEQLSENALSSVVKELCLSLAPAENLAEATRRVNETTQAKKIIEQMGTPPLSIMTELEKIVGLVTADALLIPEQINHVGAFIMSCRRMKDYLKRAESTETEIAFYGNSFIDLQALEDEINHCLYNGQINDRATPRLHDLRRSIERKTEQIKNKLDAVLQKNKKYCAEGFSAIRSGRYTLPVKKEYRSKIEGTLVELSNTGSTCFIEPSSVRKLQDELDTLKMEEDNEIRVILYTLTASIHDDLPSIKLNMEAMETLDFLFAKAKFSIDIKASPIRFTETRQIRLLSARHPLLKIAVPLDFALDEGGIVITGPNTGGKTVALKTVGLLSLMAQSGLHVPADERSSICIFNEVLCDIGDGQSISENLSTFSSHMTNIIDILAKTNQNSMILLDELGSGTDPAEGMGIAMSIIEELLTKGCLFIATTHYPEIKDFAATTPNLINARMAFDKESLMPLYKLEIGEAGESCALFIAERLGLPTHLLNRAREITYSTPVKATLREESTIKSVTPLAITDEPPKPVAIPRSQRFSIGDSVLVYPNKEIGIVYARANDKGEVGVQVKGKKRLIMHKRLKLKIASSELYPDDYDFSIIFDSVENRKAKHLMGRKHVEGNIVID
ncbi:MAG: DNA mismatch repair protein MutS [Defluviitaleaceae bacterium]|nr:DNA mismatch repair protein MutS [Defluviitaleaceae bacterium]